MSNQQPTAEKSVQTQELTGPTTVYLTNNPLTHLHTENTATEVANTLVSMATGRQRGTTVKQLNVYSTPSTQSTLPILTLSDFTTTRGVPTAMALATQAKLTPTKHNEILQTDQDDDTSMSTDEYNQSQTDGKSRTKSTRGKLNKSTSGSKSSKQSAADAIQYGPIVVKPRKNTAPTLANGRKSKDQPLPPEEDVKRRQRRDRNKEAAAKCRRKRNDLRETLEKTENMLTAEQQKLEHTVQSLANKKNELEILLHRHACTKARLPITTTGNSLNISKTDLKSIPTTTTTLLDSNNNSGNNKRVTINFTNAQDLLAVAPLSRITTDNSSGAPMITIHIVPEVAQALLGSTSVDKAKLAEFLQQATANNSSSSTTINPTSDSNTSMNSTS